jgi:hypothetical protein
MRGEHDPTGACAILADQVREQRARAQEVFVPLARPPGPAQVGFDEAVAVIGDVMRLFGTHPVEAAPHAPTVSSCRCTISPAGW